LIIAAAMVTDFRRYYGRLPNFIDGGFREVDTDAYVDTYDPGLGEVIGEVPVSRDVDDAVGAASRAFEKWSRLPIYTRLQYLVRLKLLFEERRGELVRIISQNVGKTLREAQGEVQRAIDSIDMALGVPHLVAEVRKVVNIAQSDPEIDMEYIKEPLGVFAVVTPFNFPVMIPMWFIPLAVTLGNTIVLKPSEQDPVPTTYIMGLFREAGYPPGVVNLIHGEASTVEKLVAHPEVVGVAFVGSTRVGERVYSMAAAHGKRALVGAGAKNPVVVMPDADFERTAENLVEGFFNMAGQRCLAPGNLILVGDAYDKLRGIIVDKVRRVRVGYQLIEGVDMGPLISQRSRDRVASIVAKAIDDGARALVDGREVVLEPNYSRGFYLGPTVLDNVTPDMEIAREEVFGPVMPIIRVEDFNEAVEVANGTVYGNAASIFTSSGKWGREFARLVNAGNVAINMSVAQPLPYFPFGGRKRSFFGVLHAQVDAVDFFTDRKVVMQRWW